MRKITIFTLFLCIIAVSIIMFFSNRPSYSQTQPSEGEEGACITSNCHDRIDKEKFVHSPVAASQCTECHGESPQHKASPKKYKFGAIKDIDKKCYSCHEKFEQKKFTHAPVANGECIACHNPHGSQYKFQLVAQGGDLCFNCHDKKLVSGKYAHEPAAAGECIACHAPHTADYEKNLKAKGPALCFTCHTEQAEAFQKAKVIHKPVDEDCTNCHNPHSAEKKFMLNYEAPVLCFGCHKEKKEWVEKSLIQHGALTLMTGNKSCSNCHLPHVSDIPKILSMAPMDLCLSCHDKEVKAYDGTTLTNMKKLLADNPDHHGPINEKDCSACHDPHGSEYFRILRNAYPSTFYMPYRPENYSLCFSCHEEE
ncbi:MAG: cytochrome c3 family protein, partial [Nitrospirota bacterium]